MSIVLRFFPNGEFSQGVDTSKRRKDRQRRDTPTQTCKLDIKRRDEYLQWIKEDEQTQQAIDKVSLGSIWMSHSGLRYEVKSLNLGSCALGWEDKTGGKHTTVIPQSFRTTAFLFRMTLLVYHPVESSKLATSRKKLEGMTKPMAKNIRNGVFLLEECEGGKDVLSFLTLTLPDLSTEGLRSCCEQWDYMVNRFLCWLRSALEKGGVEFQYVYCTEIQSKRLQLRGEYAPHLHIVFRGRIGKKLPWIISPKQARKAWGACIRSVVSEQFTTIALENLQRIKYSAARYLAKYLSKGKCAIPREAGQNAISSLRTQWGGMSRTISRRIKAKTIKLATSNGYGQLAVHIINRMEALVGLGYVQYYKKGFVPLGIDKTTGMEYGLHVSCGCLSTPTHKGGYDAIMGTF